MVCIIDDREDVWKFAPNLITVKKYVYFQGIGDINAPSGPREPQARKRGGWPPRPADRTLASVSCFCCGCCKFKIHCEVSSHALAAAVAEVELEVKAGGVRPKGSLGTELDRLA